MKTMISVILAVGMLTACNNSNKQKYFRVKGLSTKSRKYAFSNLIFSDIFYNAC